MLAIGQAEGLPAPDVEQFTLALRAAGSPYVWPRTWSLAGRLDDDTARQRMAAWLETFDDGGERYCGIAQVSTKGSQAEILVVVAVDAIATLNAEIPIQARSGSWITVDATTLVDFAEAKVVVLAPTGRPYTVPTSVDGNRVLGRARVDRAGMWKLQVLANADTGPRPALETIVWVDREPPAFAVEERAPGEGRADPSRAADEQLFEMLRALRAAEGLGSIVRVPWLDRLAQEHSEAMMQAQRLGHDVGHGGPEARAARALARARRTGENVAHAVSIVLAHRTLWASPSHRGNLVDPHFNAVGLGVARGPDGTLWVTQEFAELSSPL